MATSHIQPRRRGPGSEQKAASGIIDRLAAGDKSLQKGATFHSAASSPSRPDDPVLSISSIPHRSPTCPETLEKLVTASDQRVAELLDSIERSLAGKKLIVDEGQGDTQDSLPVPRVFLDHVVATADPSTSTANKDNLSLKSHVHAFDPNAVVANHSHESDSGLGSSISGSIYDSSVADHPSAFERRSNTSVYTAIRRTQTGPKSLSGKPRLLSEYASTKIRNIIVNPILAERKYKDYHPIVETIPSRIRAGTISCLRDLEKTLIFLAPSRSKSPSLYYKFCETSISYIQTTVEYLGDTDQRRPTDRPYTNNYFVDLIDQVRQYASIMAASRRSQDAAHVADKNAYSKSDIKPYPSPVLSALTFNRGERVLLRGGLSEDGQPAQLVREKNGELLPIDAGHKEVPQGGDVENDDNAIRSMARKRKCDIGKEEWRACRECGKEFKRPCDLTKHEKTHSRPWKCSVESCKYFDLGWPTEKERDRHVNDKHSVAPPLFKCLYDKCAYTSKRESNCKQHMEKAHGWEYKRSKSKKGQVLIPTVPSSSETPSVATPSSAMLALSTPHSPFTSSPAMSSNHAFSPDGSVDTSSFVPSGLNKFAGPDDLYSLENLPLNSNNPNSEMLESPEYSLETPNSDLSLFPVDAPMQSGGTDLDFSFGPVQWPPMNDFFPQYGTDAPFQAQQPTPAWSDMNLDMKDGDTSMDQALSGAMEVAQNASLLTPGAQGDSTFDNEVHESLPSHYLGQNVDDTFMEANNNQDFQLFGTSGNQNSESMPPIFGDLGDVGGQFSPAGHDPMYEAMEPYPRNDGEFQIHD